MEGNLEYLLHLCYLKNNLNLRRRRFYYHMYYGSSEFMTRYEARRGYEKAKIDMRAMTPEMMKLRQFLNVQILWDCAGNIRGIRDVAQNWYIYSKNFKSYSELWLADKALGLT